MLDRCGIESGSWQLTIQLAHHAMPPPMPYSSSEEFPSSAVPDVGPRQVGRVADSAPVVGRQRGHRLCCRIRVRLRRYCVASGDLSEGGDLELQHQRQALSQSVRARGHGGCGASSRTMRYGVELSWVLLL